MNTCAEAILNACKDSGSCAHDAAWRQASPWMQQEQIIELVPPGNPLTLSS